MILDSQKRPFSLLAMTTRIAFMKQIIVKKLQRFTVLGFLLFILFMTNGNPLAQTQESLELEKQKFEFQKEIENQKFQLEIYKAILIAASIAIPLIIGIYTIHKQIGLAYKIKEVEAKNLFELKTAELLLSSKTPGQLHSKAKALIGLFPNAPLPTDFIKRVELFNPDEFYGASIEWKLELFKMLVESKENKDEIIKLWRQIFPNDKWIEKVKNIIEKPNSGD
jgi:hypothetical protein